MAIELCKDEDGTYFIRKGTMRINCVVSKLTKKDLAILMIKIDKLLNKEL